MLGAHVGDGTLYKTKSSTVWELRGALEEKEYYINNVCPLMNQIFNEEFISKFRNDGCKGVWGVQTSKKVVTAFFQEFGFKPGTKTYTVAVPKYVFSSTIEVKRAFVRGLFDTDGCIRFERKNKNTLHTYPRIEFASASLTLRDTLRELLIDLGFRPFVWNDKISFRLCIAGAKPIVRWVTEIEPKNQKHLKKYLIWKEKGFYPMKSRGRITW